ncbi:NET domain-containing protein [Dioscorea alata]|uniref:NET domain-containing protein n=1 Tax=Dioscorea alata TaxID=55571 RepID=A0ACB7WAJ0_DIOAL|nr:NET domain-containing protein [Dioscorea alata]
MNHYYHIMSKDSRENECGPDYFGYWKHLFLDLLSPNGGALLPLKESDTEPAAGTCSVGGNGSVSYFSEALGKGLSELKKEKLNLILKQSISCLNNEADEMLDNISAAFQLEADLRGKELLGCYASASKEDLSVHSGHRKRKAPSSPMSSYPDNHTLQTAKQVYDAIQALQGSGEIGHEAVEKYLNEMLLKLGKIEVDLEDFLNVLVSKCSRPMTIAEKRRLGRLVQKLPSKAVDRLAEIIKDRNPATNQNSDTIQVDFEELDDVTLWRLHFYVENVAKANRLHT